MAQKDPSKTEEATPKRIEKAREEGNVPKSQELPKAMSIIAGILGLYVWSGVILEHIQLIFLKIFGHATEFEINSTSAYEILLWLASELAIIILPILLFIGLTIFITLRLQVGSLWTTKVFAFKWERFNLFKGLKNMFASVQTFVRLAKSLAQAIIIGIIPYFIISSEASHFLPLYYADAYTIGSYIASTGLRIVMITVIPMGVIAAADLWYTRYQYNENLKMTKQEVKDEFKQSQGDQQVKSRQRQKMMEMLGKRQLKDIPRADVIITNPTHLAIAIRYDGTEAPAPIVIAKGADHIAAKIREIAKEHRIPIKENVPLARALYKSVEVGEMIPEDLYKAVASILAEIWRIKGKRAV